MWLSGTFAFCLFAFLAFHTDLGWLWVRSGHRLGHLGIHFVSKFLVQINIQFLSILYSISKNINFIQISKVIFLVYFSYCKLISIFQFEHYQIKLQAGAHSNFNSNSLTPIPTNYLFSGGTILVHRLECIVWVGKYEK